MTPLMITILAFVGVTALIGFLVFTFGEKPNRVDDRLDLLTGKRKKDDEAATILKKTAFDKDKKSLLELITPNLPSLQKIIVEGSGGMHLLPAGSGIQRLTHLSREQKLACLAEIDSWDDGSRNVPQCSSQPCVAAISHGDLCIATDNLAKRSDSVLLAAAVSLRDKPWEQ